MNPILLLGVLLIFIPNRDVSWARPPVQEARAPGLSEHTIEIGPFPSQRQARDVRNLVNNLAPARVEGRDEPSGGRTYRVLLGQFHSLAHAETLIREAQLKRLFAQYWVNAVRIDHEQVVVPPDASSKSTATQPSSNEAEKPDPYTLHAHLMCGPEQKKGTYRAQFEPPQDAPGSQVSLQLEWSCLPPGSEGEKLASAQKATPPPPSNDEFPKYVAASFLAGYGSVQGQTSTGEAVAPAGLLYGGEISAYVPLIYGIGPVLDYRFLVRRLAWGSGFSNQFDQRLNAGVNLPLGRFFEFQPLLGFFSQNFVVDGTPEALTYETLYVPQFGLSAKLNILRPKAGLALDLVGRAHYLIPMATSRGGTLSGFQVSGQLRTRLIHPGRVGGDWFLEVSHRLQEHATQRQNETLFLGGLSILFSPAP